MTTSPAPVRMSISQYGFVGQAVAERCRLDAEAGDRAAEGDRLELGHHKGRQSESQRRGNEVLVRAHAGDVGCLRLGVDRDDLRQAGCVKALGVCAGTATEQVRCLLGEPNRAQSAGPPDSSQAGASRRWRERCARQSQERTRSHASLRPNQGEDRVTARISADRNGQSWASIPPGRTRKVAGDGCSGDD